MDLYTPLRARAARLKRPESALSLWTMAPREGGPHVLRTLSASCLTDHFFDHYFQNPQAVYQFDAFTEGNPAFWPEGAQAAARALARLAEEFVDRPPRGGTRLPDAMDALHALAYQGLDLSEVAKQMAARALDDEQYARTTARSQLSGLLLGLPGMPEEENARLHALFEEFVLRLPENPSLATEETSYALLRLLKSGDVSLEAMRAIACTPGQHAAQDYLAGLPKAQADEETIRALAERSEEEYPELRQRLYPYLPRDLLMRYLQPLAARHPREAAAVLRDLRPDISLSPDEALPLLSSGDAELRLIALSRLSAARLPRADFVPRRKRTRP